MPRSIVLSFALLIAACAGEDPAPGGEARADAQVLVATEPEVPDDRPVVVFLGTSLTAGLGLSGPEESYVARISEMADSAGTPVRAVNAGVSGETSAGGLRRLDWVLREPLDVLVVELGANDGLRGLDAFQLSNNLIQIAQSTRTRYPAARVVIAGMEAPPNMGQLYTEAFRTVFTSVAAEADAELIPFLLDGVAGVPELNQSDGIHPTPEGHRLMAQNAWAVLGPLFSELHAGRS